MNDKNTSVDIPVTMDTNKPKKKSAMERKNPVE